MSHTKLKQLLGPSSTGGNKTLGSAIIFDGGKPLWSVENKTAMLLPAGLTNERPNINDLTDGHIRCNKETHKLEMYTNSNWLEIGMMTGASSGVNGKYGLVPTPLAGQNDKFLRGDGTWQYAPVGFRLYTFGVQLDSSGNINATDFILNQSLFGETWTYSRTSATTLEVTHNKNTNPILITVLGYKSAGGVGYTQKIPTGNPTSTFSVAYNTSNKFTIYSLSGTYINAENSSVAIVQAYFAG